MLNKMNQNRQIVRFLFVVLLIALPLIILVSLYVVFDPFKVVKKYDTFYVNDHKPSAFLNNDYVSTSTYDRWKDTYHYNSFIMGNSLSRLFHIEDWKIHLPEGSNCYHFDASGEPLYGIWRKIQYIDKQGSCIDNVIIIIMAGTLEGDHPNDGHIFMISPQLEENRNYWPFQKESFLAFCSPKFLFSYLYYEITGVVLNYALNDGLIIADKDDYDYTTNEGSADLAENKIKNGSYYTQAHIDKFDYSDEQGVDVAYIKAKQESMLLDIKAIFDKHNTDFKIVVCPTIGCNKLNPVDFGKMVEIFGEDRVFDLTPRDSLSLDYTNFYLDGHIRPKGTKMIMDRIYNE